MPRPIADAPELSSFHARLCEQYLQIAAMRPEGLGGARGVTLREIQIYLEFYPVDDVHEFVDHILSIDREVLSDVGKPSSRHN